jgi:nicotinate-nucleotide adenylyltransferase
MATPDGRAIGTTFLTPLAFERKVLASAGVPVEQIHVCGPGREGIRRWADQHGEPEGPIVLVGLAGGLDPRLVSGDLVVVDEVVDPHGRLIEPPIGRRLRIADAKRGRVTTTGRVVASAEAKHALGRTTGAVIVDLESLHFAELARERDWDWGIIRVVGDPADQAVPAALDRFVDHLGRIRLGVVAGEIFRRPALLGTLRLLARQSRSALTQLGAALRDLSVSVPESADAGEGPERFGRRTGPRSILVFGGSFDPPHRGHLTLPFEAAARLGCDEVVFIPARVNPLKVDTPPANPEARVRMLEAALALRKSVPGHPPIKARIDRREIDRDGPSFTFATLESIHRELVEAAERDGLELRRRPRLRLLIGSDQALDFDRWRDWRKIIALAPPIVMPRPPETRTSLASRYRDHFDPTLAGRWATWTLDLAAEGVSSSEIRDRRARGEDVSALLPEGVLEIIEELGLYEASP